MGVKSLGVSDLDRLSSLTTRPRDIGKANVRETLGNSTHSAMSPPSATFPPKPDVISRDPVASGEWDRIIAALRTLPYILEVGEDPVVDGAQYYSTIATFRDALAVQGRNRFTRPMAEDADRMVWRYLSLLREELLGIAPGPMVALRKVV